MKHDRLYHIWYDMNRRCTDPKNAAWHLYGGRGICVCPGWQRYETFREWALANGYEEHLTVERIDTDGDYSPGNCTWATMKVQCNNRRNNLRITYGGKAQTLMQWADEIGVKYHTLYSRIALYGWPLEMALRRTVT